MGYRKAAMLRRTQYVRGHYRTNSKGESYWVEGHVRNEPPDDIGTRIIKTFAAMTLWGMFGWFPCLILVGLNTDAMYLPYIGGFVLLGIICSVWIWSALELDDD